MAGFPLVIAHSGAVSPKIQGLKDFAIGSNPMLELLGSTKQPLYMSEPVADSGNQKVNIQLYNWSAETRLCIIASKFVPYVGSAFNDLHVLSEENPWVKRKTNFTPTLFKTGRVLGEEYQYILNRKTQTSHWAGNLLTKPSVLLSPWVSHMRETKFYLVYQLYEKCSIILTIMPYRLLRNALLLL